MEGDFYDMADDKRKRCPVCDGNDKSCRVCGGRGWVSVDKWDQVVDEGHKKIMAEVKEERRQEAALQRESLDKVALAFQNGMNAVAQEWERAAKDMLATGVDAGVYARIVGGLLTGYVIDLSEQMKLGRHAMLARMFVGVLSFLERVGDYEAVRILAAQSAELLGSMNMFKKAVDEGEMN